MRRISAGSRRRKAGSRPRVKERPPPGLTLSLPLASYAGTYRNEWLGTLTLEARGAELAARLGDLAFELATPAEDHVELSGPLEATGVFELDGKKVLAFTLDLGEPVRFAR